MAPCWPGTGMARSFPGTGTLTPRYVAFWRLCAWQNRLANRPRHQVTDEGLKVLGKHYNQTFYDYDQGNGTPTRRYFLDVNSWAWQRDRGDGANVRTTIIRSSPGWKLIWISLLQIIDARFISVENGLFIDITGLSEVYPDTQPGIIMCKNDHKYRLRDIFPLRETHFEGVKAKVPYSYVPILIEEYSEQALITTEFHK